MTISLAANTMRHKHYPGTLKVVAFRRCLHAFQRVLDGNHRAAWFIANDLYDRLRDGRLDKSGRALNQGPEFNATRQWWQTLLIGEYDSVRVRFNKAFELVSKAGFMLRNGKLEFKS